MLSYTLPIVAALSVGSVSHVQVLEQTSSRFAVKVNVRALAPHVQIGTKWNRDNVALAFTGNYFYNRTPIGLLWDNKYIPSILKYTDIRPRLIINSDGAHITKTDVTDRGIMLQAGPTLIENGTVNVQLTAEKFQGDIRRAVQQVSVGVTKEHKLIVLFSTTQTPKSIAQTLLSFGCVQAMRMDGGSSAFLYLNDKHKTIQYGKPNFIKCTLHYK